MEDTIVPTSICSNVNGQVRGEATSIKYAVETHPGYKRKNNEDNFLTNREVGLYLLADGMGGHSGGEVASRKAVSIICDFILQTSLDEEITWPFHKDINLSWEANRLATAIKLANNSIHRIAKKSEKLAKMGTTVAALFFGDCVVNIAHVGDSRIYRIRDGEILQLTEDHSLLMEQLKKNMLTEEEVRNFPFRNVITRALGIDSDVAVSVRTEKTMTGDIFLLCTDGLNTQVEDDKICRIINAEPDICKSCELLVQEANKAGGKDNVTVILVQIVL